MEAIIPPARPPVARPLAAIYYPYITVFTPPAIPPAPRPAVFVPTCPVLRAFIDGKFAGAMLAALYASCY